MPAAFFQSIYRMRIIIYCLLLLFGAGIMQSTAQQCDAVTGKWLNQDRQAEINITRKGSYYSGVIIWLKNPMNNKGRMVTDLRNIRPIERKRSLLNLEILKGFICDGHKLVNGTIYDPRRGKVFQGEIIRIGNKLRISVIVGMFAAGNEVWTKVSAN
jgi:uncharacterized protein (DUF2147 family)